MHGGTRIERVCKFIGRFDQQSTIRRLGRPHESVSGLAPAECPEWPRGAVNPVRLLIFQLSQGRDDNVSRNWAHYNFPVDWSRVMMIMQKRFTKDERKHYSWIAWEWENCAKREIKIISNSIWNELELSITSKSCNCTYLVHNSLLLIDP